MARISSPPISAAMYRNFAAVTICVTASLAILADGEKRAAHTAQLNPPASQSVQTAETRDGFVVTEDFAGGSGGSAYGAEFDSGYGKPTTRVTSSGSSLRLAMAPGSNGNGIRMTAPTGYGIHGLTEEELARMSDTDRAALENLLKGGGPPNSEANRRRQASDLRQASLARSGAENSDDF